MNEDVTVWVVRWQDYEDDGLVGVYSTRERAEAVKAAGDKRKTVGYVVNAVVVDAEPEYP